MKKSKLLLYSALLVALLLPQNAYSKKIKYSSNIVYNGEVKKEGKQNVPYGQGSLTAKYYSSKIVECTISGRFVDNNKVDDATLMVYVYSSGPDQFSISGNISYSITENELAISVTDFDDEIIKKDYNSRNKTIVSIDKLVATINPKDPKLYFNVITEENKNFSSLAIGPSKLTEEWIMEWPSNSSDKYNLVEQKRREVQVNNTKGGIITYSYIDKNGSNECLYNDNDVIRYRNGIIQLSEDGIYAITGDWQTFVLCKDMPDTVINALRNLVIDDKNIPSDKISSYSYYQGSLIKCVSDQTFDSIMSHGLYENYYFSDGWVDIQKLFFTRLEREISKYRYPERVYLIPFEERAHSIQMGMPSFSKQGDEEARYMIWAGGRPVTIMGHLLDDLIAPLHEEYDLYVRTKEENERAKEAEKEQYKAKHGFDIMYKDVAIKYGDATVKKYLNTSDYVIIGFQMQCMLDIIKAHNNNISYLYHWYYPDFDREWTDANGSWQLYIGYNDGYEYRIWVKNGKINDFSKRKLD